MKRRALDDWRQLIKQQQNSGLSIAAFCKDNKLPTSNFYKFRARLQGNEQTPKLVKIKTKAVTPIKSSITLTHGKTQLTFPSDSSPQWLAKFIRELNE